MHKGYTLNYFINFFQSIPTSQWVIGGTQEDSIRSDATGHALRNSRTTLARTTRLSKVRLKTLTRFLGGRNVVNNINDGVGKYAALGSTPRGRVLRALRNRKRTGSVLG